jgi:hypothetical protein
LGDLAVGVVEVSEEAGACGADLDALGGQVAYVDSLEAEGTFLGDADGSYGYGGIAYLEL